tara:strand:+ start:223 stop:540 length:318 start_codon:yes stop_codon:yes gene_type:complete
MFRTLEKIRLFTDAATVAAGSEFYVERSKGWTFVIAATSVTNGATVDIEAYIGTSWFVIHSETISDNGSFMIRDDHGHYEKIRGNVSARTDGTYNVYARGTTDSL